MRLTIFRDKPASLQPVLKKTATKGFKGVKSAVQSKHTSKAPSTSSPSSQAGRQQRGIAIKPPNTAITTPKPTSENDF
jgi:hypothetical protein